MLSISKLLDKVIFTNVDKKADFVILINNKKEHNAFKGLQHYEEWENIKGDDNKIYNRDLYKVIDEKEFIKSLEVALFIHFFNPSDLVIEVIKNKSTIKTIKIIQ